MAAPDTTLLDFVTKLQDDPPYCARFNADKVGVMTAAGLSADDQNIILTGNLDALNKAIGQQWYMPQTCGIIWKHGG